MTGDESVSRPWRFGRKEVTERVRAILADLGDYRHLDVRSHGAHIVIGPPHGLVARLTALGDDAFGLSFRAAEGGWEPMLVVDTLDAVLHDMIAAVDLRAA